MLFKSEADHGKNHRHLYIYRNRDTLYEFKFEYGGLLRDGGGGAVNA